MTAALTLYSEKKISENVVGFGLPTLESRFIRIFDVVAASLVLLFTFPLLILISGIIYFSDFGPVAYRHRRIGQGGRVFYCLKFRTMAVDAEVRLERLLATDPAARAEWAQTHMLRHDPRITRFGRYLRRSSIDELPQVLNVLRGDMSMVGPRPITEGEIGKYGRHFRDYLAVRPGMTGLWKHKGRLNATYTRQVALDHLYAKRRNVGLYSYILVTTFLRRSPYSASSAID